jgi:hypothetical protein
MPLLRFNMIEGRTDAELNNLLDAAHAAVVAAFHVPEGDRYQIVSEYKPGRLRALDTGLGIPRTDKLIIGRGHLASQTPRAKAAVLSVSLRSA